MKAVCVLEAILRKKDDDQFPIAASYFTEKKDVVVRCSESPQASLREKANKVYCLPLEFSNFYAVDSFLPIERKHIQSV